MEELSEEKPASIRRGLVEARAHRELARGLVIVNTGDGKGKTTAALGVLLRATGQNRRVVMLQFLKASTRYWGEIRAAERLGVRICPLGDGFTWTSKDLEKDRALARHAWFACRSMIESEEYDVVILDEITYALNCGWIELSEVLTTLRNRRSAMHVVLTGRDAPEGLIEFADLVTEMREVKHPYKLQGMMAQRGIEF